MEFKATTWMVIQYIITNKLLLVLLMVLAFVMGCAIFFFLVFHLVLLFRGLTTNETYKWDSVIRLHGRLVQAYKLYMKKLADGTLTPEEWKAITHQESSEVEKKEAEINDEMKEENTEERNNDDKSNSNADHNGTLNGHANNKEIETVDKEEKEEGMDQKVNKQEYDDDGVVGCMPAMLSNSIKEEERIYYMHPVRQVIEKHSGIPTLTDSDPGPTPVNIYRIGLINTLKRIVFPPALQLMESLLPSTTKKIN
mmetsp:Transcript_6914/g.9536  ORF Transcript_6914/g.9536 Transcript_6914/m.9536 type:complete len:253 (+) Transcript_6914:151-909(+)